MIMSTERFEQAGSCRVDQAKVEAAILKARQQRSEAIWTLLQGAVKALHAAARRVADMAKGPGHPVPY